MKIEKVFADISSDDFNKISICFTVNLCELCQYLNSFDQVLTELYKKLIENVKEREDLEKKLFEITKEAIRNKLKIELPEIEFVSLEDKNLIVEAKDDVELLFPIEKLDDYASIIIGYLDNLSHIDEMIITLKHKIEERIQKLLVNKEIEFKI